MSDPTEDPRIAGRARAIEPFYVMEVVKEAERLAASGRSVVHLSIGEPDFPAPAPVQAAAKAAIDRGATSYTQALGLPELREAIARYYADRFDLAIDPGQIIVTAGASAGLLLCMAALLERDHELLLPDPSYPCNRHFAAVFEGRARLLPCSAAAGFHPSAEMIDQAWRTQTGGVLLASPSNPTGTSIAQATLSEIAAVTRGHGGFLLVDEIYGALVYGHPARCVLQVEPQAIVLNSFSKTWAMTGWRLGWLVAPKVLVPAFEKLAQNLFICPSTIAQHAALACFSDETWAITEARRREFASRREFMLAELADLGFGIPAPPDGAFYIYADITRFSQDSWSFAFELLRETGVCLVPGRDFGTAEPQRYVRISYANSAENLREAIDRMRRYLKRR
jgi:aspartate/methionine/tyrosine aminotransferase